MTLKTIVSSFAFVLTACIVRIDDIPVPGPVSPAGYEELRAKAMAEGQKASKAELEKRYAYEPSHPIAARANAQLGRVLAVLGSRSEAPDRPRIRIVVQVEDEPFAISFPTGLILIASSLVDPTSRHATKDSALFGVIAHEVSHIVNEHVLNQSIQTFPRRASVSIGLPNPFVIGSRSRGSELVPTTLEPPTYEKAIEFFADANAAGLLLRTSQPLTDYIELLESQSARSARVSHGWLADRAGALRVLASATSTSHRLTVRLGQQSMQVSLSRAAHRHELFVAAAIYLPAGDAAQVMNWIRSDGSATLEDAAPGLQSESRQLIEAVVINRL